MTPPLWASPCNSPDASLPFTFYTDKCTLDLDCGVECGVIRTGCFTPAPQSLLPLACPPFMCRTLAQCFGNGCGLGRPIQTGCGVWVESFSQTYALSVMPLAVCSVGLEEAAQVPVGWQCGQRKEVKESGDFELAPINILITVIGSYFGQVCGRHVPRETGKKLCTGATSRKLLALCLRPDQIFARSRWSLMLPCNSSAQPMLLPL